MRVCLQELCPWTCLPTSPAHSVTVGVRLKKMFGFVSVWFKTGIFISVVSIHVQNTETNRKKIFFGFVKQTEKQPKQIEFRFFSVQTENLFVCFEDTLHPTPFRRSPQLRNCLGPTSMWLLQILERSWFSVYIVASIYTSLIFCLRSIL